jgi:hypothetical protein
MSAPPPPQPPWGAMPTKRRSPPRHPRLGATGRPQGTPATPSDLFVAACLNLDPCGPAFVPGVASKVAARSLGRHKAATTNSDQVVTE